MTGAPIDLLAECEAHGIRLALAGDGGLTIDAPQYALTPDLLDRLKSHKVELLAMLRPALALPAPPKGNSQIPVQKLPKPKPICRCGSTTWRDTPIHDQQSIRRDCAECGRFLDFPVWYGKAMQNKTSDPENFHANH